MKLIKYSIKNYISNIYFNILIFFQMVLTLFVLIYTAYTFQYKYKYFIAFDDELKHEGILVDIESMVYNGSAVIDSKTLEAFYNLKGVQDICGVYSVFGEVDNCDTRMKAYDRKIIESFIPDMKEGHWLNKGTKQLPDYFEVVVSENEYGLKCGDYIEIEFGNKSYQAKIIGVLDRNAAIFSKCIHTSYKESYEDMYWNYSAEYEQKMLILMDRESLTEPEMFCILSGTALICYEDEITDEEKAENLVRLFDGGFIVNSTEFPTIYRNSMELFKFELRTFIPVVSLLLLLVVCTAVKISYINVDNTLGSFAVYYMLGCSWGCCKGISVISSCWSLAAAIMANSGIWMFLMFTDKLAYDKSLFRYMNLIYLCVTFIYLAAIFIYQNILFNKFTPFQIMRGDNND